MSAAAPGMTPVLGWIWLRDIALEDVRVGALPAERQRGQAVALDVGVRVDLAAAAASDQLADTLDWSALHARIDTTVRRRHWALIEALAVGLAGELLAEGGVEEVQVEVRKPACLPSGCAAVSVHLHRPGPQR